MLLDGKHKCVCSHTWAELHTGHMLQTPSLWLTELITKDLAPWLWFSVGLPSHYRPLVAGFVWGYLTSQTRWWVLHTAMRSLCLLRTIKKGPRRRKVAWNHRRRHSVDISPELCCLAEQVLSSSTEVVKSVLSERVFDRKWGQAWQHLTGLETGSVLLLQNASGYTNRARLTTEPLGITDPDLTNTRGLKRAPQQDDGCSIDPGWLSTLNPTKWAVGPTTAAQSR